MDGPANNPPNWEMLGVYQRTIPELTVLVYWYSAPPFWQQFLLDADPDTKWLSGTVSNTRCGCCQVRLKIQRMILWWKSMVRRHCILQWRVWCMLCGLMTKKLNKMWRTGWYRLQALDDKVVVAIDTCQWKTTRPDTKGECTPHWSWVDRARVSKSDDPGEEVHFMGCFRSTKGLSMVASMFFISVGRHGGLQQRFWTIVRWMATRHFGGFSDFPLAERDISAHACEWNCRVSRTWQRLHIKRDTPSRREKWKCSAQCTHSTKGVAILSSSWPSLSFEVVANQVFCGSCGYIPHVCRNGQWPTHRNAPQIPGFMKSHWIGNHKQHWRDMHKSFSSKPYSNNSEVLGIEWAAAGICTSCAAGAKQSTTLMVTEYVSWRLWYLCAWSPRTLWSGPNTSPARLDG